MMRTIVTTAVEAKEFWSAEVITAVGVVILGILGSVTAFYKIRVAQVEKERDDALKAAAEKREADLKAAEEQHSAQLTLAAAQIKFLVKPMQDELAIYRAEQAISRNRIEALEKERAQEKRDREREKAEREREKAERAREKAERAKEKKFLIEYRNAVAVFAAFLDQVDTWIDENITDRKTEKPKTPPEVEKYKNGVEL
jgi:uncharacterized protein YpmB